MKAQPPAVQQVREYLAAQPAPARRALTAIRGAIRAAVPGAVEHFSYRIPGFRLEGQALVWYAGFRRHVSLYPMTDAIRRAHAAAIEGYKTSKGTIQFPLSEPLPLALVKRLVRARAAEIRKTSRRR
jgi:uncharacterized protein YdhG (YjbR/CyaY superfamily)